MQNSTLESAIAVNFCYYRPNLMHMHIKSDNDSLIFECLRDNSIVSAVYFQRNPGVSDVYDNSFIIREITYRTPLVYYNTDKYQCWFETKLKYSQQTTSFGTAFYHTNRSVQSTVKFPRSAIMLYKSSWVSVDQMMYTSNLLPCMYLLVINTTKDKQYIHKCPY